MAKKYIVDTNALIDHLHDLDGYSLVLLNHVLRELEKHKSSKNNELAYKAREVSRFIRKNEDKFIFDGKDYDGSDYGDNKYEDNNILKACTTVRGNEVYGLITGDSLLRYRAKSLDIEVMDVSELTGKNDEEQYNGVKEVYVTKTELEKINRNLDINSWGLVINQYIIFKDDIDDSHLDCFKWTGDHLARVESKGFTTNQFGKFKPYDFYQKSALDSIRNNIITSLKGYAGSGKSLIALSTAWNLIEKNDYDRLIIFTNPVKTRNAQELGFYTGSRTEKLMQSSIGVMLSSKFGKESEVEHLIQNGKITLLPFSDIRGFDTSSEQKTIVFITEAQNLNSDLLKLALQRVGDNTKVIIDGDPKAQLDMDAYKHDNGMMRMSEVFRGQDLYGEVTLNKIYRSRIAEIAESM